MTPLLSSALTLLAKLYGIFLGFLGISFLVAIHELGHFFCCKLFGVHTPSFSLGFGPRLYTKKIGATEFSLSAIPLGGYVEIAGVEEVGQGEQKFSHDRSNSSFANKPYYQKLIILLGGIAVNIAFAWIALALLFTFNGIPAHQAFGSKVVTNRIESIVPGSPAEKAGLKAGEWIESPEHDKGTLSEFLRTKAGKKVTLLVRNEPSAAPSQVEIELDATEGAPSLGVKFELQASAPLPFNQAVSQSGATIYSWITSTFSSLANMFTKRTTQGLGGPIAVIHSITKSADRGFVLFIVALCFISVGIACINLVPLPIFDGGQVLFETITALSGRPLNNVRAWIHTISWIAVIGLILLLTWRDVARIIFGAL